MVPLLDQFPEIKRSYGHDGIDGNGGLNSLGTFQNSGQHVQALFSEGSWKFNLATPV